MVSENQELALLLNTLALNNSTVFQWNLNDQSLLWAGNAAVLLGFSPDSPPRTIVEWINCITEPDRERFISLQPGVYRCEQEVDMEYTLQLSPNTPKLRIRHTGRVTCDAAGKPETLASILLVSHPNALETPSAFFSYLAQSLPDRRGGDRKGYHYPSGFMKHLYRAIDHSNTSGETGVFLLLAVNNLSMLISAYGVEASERILMDIKHTIQSQLQPQDCVERIHRDQMGIVMAGCDRKTAEHRALAIKLRIQEVTLQSTIGPVHIICSIGSVAFPESAATVSEALDKAYIALGNDGNLPYNAFEDTEHNGEESRQQMALANYLHDAIVENRLRMAYQPIISAKTGTVAHYESLLRIVDKEGKISSAGPLIPIAERMGLIDVIDRMVAEKVVEELRAHPGVSLAFNISGVTTGNTEWVRFLSKLIGETPAIASRMIVEITETAAQKDLRETAYFVASLQALGCLVSLDDFGSGYTSFRQLKALSVDMLKIDGAFIRDLMDNSDNRFFVKTLLDFTTGYGLHAVAEFVETGEVAKMLIEMGVEYMQGYYFSEPLNHRPWLNEGEYKAS